MDSGDNLPGEWIGLAQPHQILQEGAHRRDLVGHDGSENARHLVLLEKFAGGVKLLAGQIGAVKINSAVAVDLKIEGTAFH